MPIGLFAGIPVRHYTAAAACYERLLGARPSFMPNDTEAVWELGDHRYVFIEVRPEHAGHAMHTVFVGDFDARISQIAERGPGPAEGETYTDGVRQAIFRDPDGNEIGFGGAAALTRSQAARAVTPSACRPAAVRSAATRWPTRPSVAAAISPQRTRWWAADWSQQHRPSKNRSGSAPSTSSAPPAATARRIARSRPLRVLVVVMAVSEGARWVLRTVMGPTIGL
jgi:hypothetical protein